MRCNEQVQQHVPCRLAEKFFPSCQDRALSARGVDLTRELDQNGVARLQLGDARAGTILHIAFQIMSERDESRCRIEKAPRTCMISVLDHDAPLPAIRQDRTGKSATYRRY